MISSVYSIRNNNESLVLKAIIENGPISRASLSELTTLNKASISSIVKTLIEERLVNETGIGDASSMGGRKPILLEYNSSSGAVVAIDIGYNYINVLVTFLDGKIILEQQLRKIEINTNTINDLLTDILDYVIENVPKTNKGIIGCALSIHGITQNNTINFSPIYDLIGDDLYQFLSNKYDFPFYFENEANLAALGEYTFVSRAEDLLCISIHGGIGLGIIENGLLHHGNAGKAGEIGHSIIFPDGKACRCGNKGCLEKYASQQAIYESVAETFDIDINKINSDYVVKMLSTDHREPLLELLQEKAMYLSLCINNIILFHDPEVVYIDSSVYEKIPVLLEFIHDSLNSRFTEGVKIKTSAFEGRSTLFGGVALVLRNFLNIPVFKLRNYHQEN